MAINSLLQSSTLSVQQPFFLPELSRMNVLSLCLALVLLVYLYSLRSHDPKEPPLYGRGEPDLQAALQKGYDQV